MKWRLSLLLLTLLVLPIFPILSNCAIRFGFGGGANYFTAVMGILGR